MNKAPLLVIGIVIVVLGIYSKGVYRGRVPTYIKDANLKQKIREGVRKRYYERMKRIRDKADLLRLPTSPIDFIGGQGTYEFRYKDLIINWVDAQNFVIRFRGEVVYSCEFGYWFMNSFGRLRAFRNDVLGWQELFNEMESVCWDYYNSRPKLFEKRKLDPEMFG